MNNALIEMLRLILLIAAAWALWHFGFRQLLLDRHRQQLFEIRDELFEAARNGRCGLGFDSPAYRAMEGAINREIRYLHEVSPLVLIVCLRTLLEGRGALAKVLKSKVKCGSGFPECTPDAAKLFTGMDSRINAVRLRHMAMSWPFTYACLIAYVALNHAKLGSEAGIKAADEVVQRQGDRVIRLSANLEHYGLLGCRVA